jgi:hypothetical protein
MISGANSSCVYGFSSDSHELIDLFEAEEGEMITCMDAIILSGQSLSNKEATDVNPIFVYGTSHEDKNGRVLFRKNWSNSPQALELNGQASALKFSPNNQYILCGTTRGCICIIKVQQDGSIRESDRQPIINDKEIPLAINFSDNNSDTEAILTMDTRRHYRLKIDNPSKLEELEDKQTYSISMANLVYHNQVNLLPVVIGQELEYIAATRGPILELWKSVRDLEVGCSFKMSGHSSDIHKIEVSSSKDFLYSIGKDDNCLIEWKVSLELSSKAENSSAALSKNDLSRIQNVLSDEQEDAGRIARELTFCLNIGEKSLKYRDSFTMFRGTTVRQLNTLNLKALRNLRDRDSKDELLPALKRVPEITLTLNHVYGIESFNRRKTVYFLHYYSIKERASIINPTQTGPQPEIKDLVLPENYLREMLFSKYTPIPYDQKHENCERFIAYFCSRIAVVAKYTAGPQVQRFYEGHRARISCMAVHPSSELRLPRNDRGYGRGRAECRDPRVEHDRLLPHEKDPEHPCQWCGEHGVFV